MKIARLRHVTDFGPDEKTQAKSDIEAVRTLQDDAEWAKLYCAIRGLRYLSHERYGSQLKIAVEEPAERYEISVDRSSPMTAPTEANAPSSA